MGKRFEALRERDRERDARLVQAAEDGDYKAAKRLVPLRELATSGDAFIAVGFVWAKGQTRVPLAGARATVETSGQLEKRVTATRLILTGPLAFGLRKKKDDRELYLTVENEGAGAAFVVEVPPQRQKKARTFAARVNAEGATGAPPSDDTPEDLIAKLAALRDGGALTEEEFSAKKAELLERI